MHRSAFAVLFLFATIHASASQPDIPDWVRSAASQKLPDYPPETKAVVLMDDITYTVAPDGSATEHHRHVLKILRRQGRDYGILAVPFDRDTKTLSLHVWSIGVDGHAYAIKEKKMVEYGYPGQGNPASIFWGIGEDDAGTPNEADPIQGFTLLIEMPQFEALLSASQAAPLLNLHPNTLLLWAREGKVPSLRLGRRVAFRASSLNEWLTEQYTSVAVRAAQPERMAA